MSRRAAFQDVLNHKTPDRVILDLDGCPLSGMESGSRQKLMAFLGYKGYKSITGYGIDERILQMLDIDTRGVGYILKPEKSVYHRLSDTSYIDEWGVKRQFTGRYWDITESPLENAHIDELGTFRWPEPESISKIDLKKIEQNAKYLFEETDYIVCASHPVYGIFELGCWMCGFEDFMLKMAIEPEFVHRFFEIILNYQKRVIEMYYDKIGKYIHYTSSGDDFATQSSTMISPAMFDNLIKPYYRERIAYTKQFTDAPYLHHSCGNIYGILQSFIDCGVDILNPIQPCSEDMQPENLKRTFGGNIVFHGGLDTQELLPNGNEEEIHNAVNKLLTCMMPQGGYIFAAAHNIQDDVPAENIVAMFRTARDFC